MNCKHVYIRITKVSFVQYIQHTGMLGMSQEYETYLGTSVCDLILNFLLYFLN